MLCVKKNKGLLSDIIAEQQLGHIPYLRTLLLYRFDIGIEDLVGGDMEGRLVHICVQRQVKAPCLRLGHPKRSVLAGMRHEDGIYLPGGAEHERSERG